MRAPPHLPGLPADVENATRLPGLPLHMSEPKSDDSLSSGASSLATAAPVGAAGAAASAFAPAAFGAPAFGPTASSGSEAASEAPPCAETADALPEAQLRAVKNDHDELEAESESPAERPEAEWSSLPR